MGDHRTRGAAVVTGAHGGVIFGPVDLCEAVGNRDDQSGVGRVPPLAAQRLAKMGGAAPEQSIAGNEVGTAGALVDKAGRQGADMKLGLPVAQGAGAAPFDFARTVEPILERRPCQDGAGGVHGRSPRRRAKRALSPGALVIRPARPFSSPLPGARSRSPPGRKKPQPCCTPTSAIATRQGGDGSRVGGEGSRLRDPAKRGRKSAARPRPPGPRVARPEDKLRPGEGDAQNRQRSMSSDSDCRGPMVAFFARYRQDATGLARHHHCARDAGICRRFYQSLSSTE